MARPNIREIRKVQDSLGIWACPCGRQGTYAQIAGHRKGAEKRPACQGDMYHLEAPTAALPEGPLPEGPSEVGKVQKAQNWPGGVYEFEPTSRPEDAEQVARKLLEQQEQSEARVLPLGEFAPGELVAEPQEGQAGVTQASIAVRLPIKVQVYYDYFRADGWDEGDGSISAFVATFLLEHLEGCLDLGVYVLDRREVKVA